MNSLMEISLRMRRILWRPGDPILPLLGPNSETNFRKAIAVGEPGECWLWTNATDPGGYGMFKLGGNVRVAAHRLAYALDRGEPGKSHVCHRCDNPTCVNPDHLFLGTAKANAQDKVQKGRARGRFSAQGSKRETAPCPDAAVSRC
jgi:hypothetical protein